MMSGEPEEYIETLKERIDYLQRNLKMVDRSLQIALELKEKYRKQLNEQTRSNSF